MFWIRIRIRSEPKLFAGSGSGIIHFGSGSDELQFLDLNSMKSAEHPLVTAVNFTVRTKKFTGRYLGFKNLLFEIKICAADLLKNFAFASLLKN